MENFIATEYTGEQSFTYPQLLVTLLHRTQCMWNGLYIYLHGQSLLIILVGNGRYWDS